MSVEVPFRVDDTLAGREILLTGATGFVGKVLLVMLLERVPGIRRVHLVIRPNGDGDARARFERIANTSPAFAPLHARHGDALSAFLQEKVRVHDGDITRPAFGVPSESVAGVDLVIGVAATVDFDPDVRHAVRTNVRGALHAAELADAVGAGLVQISTCFVNGRQTGRLPERALDTLPNGQVFDAEAEFASLLEAIDAQKAHHASDAFRDELLEAARAKLAEKGHTDPDASRLERAAARGRDARVNDDWRTLGTNRADARGWPNTYTYTKGLAERLLFERFPTLPKAIVRPAVVESALAFPFPGWNEGFNTCGPLAYLIGTWFKALPGRKDNPFDVIPVDMVCEGVCVAASAVLRGESHGVYQCGTSDRNMLTLGRANELTGLGQRRWLRRNGATMTDRFVRSRADTTLFDQRHPLSVDSVDEAFSRTAAWLRELPSKTPDDLRARANKAAFKIERKRRDLKRVRLMVDAFTPFTRDLRQVFESRALSTHAVEDAFAWRPERIDWRDYWLNVHMPGMRKWSFPLFEGDDAPTLESPHRVDLQTAEAAE